MVCCGRANLIRKHGLFAPAHPWRRQVTGTGAEGAPIGPADLGQRLNRVFGIEITLCPHCDGRLRVIAEITDPKVIGRILEPIRRDRLPGAPPVRMSSD